MLDALQERGVNHDQVFELASDANFVKAAPSSQREAFRQLGEYAQSGGEMAGLGLIAVATADGFPKLSEADQSKLLVLQGEDPLGAAPLRGLADGLSKLTLDPAVREDTMRALISLTKRPEALFALSTIAQRKSYESIGPELQRLTLDAVAQHGGEPEKMKALRELFVGPDLAAASPAEQRKMIVRAVGGK